MDATLITAGALALALLVVVLLLIHLNRRAVKYRETETFPAFESGIQRENFFSQEPLAETSPASPSPAAYPSLKEDGVEETPEEAHQHAEATASDTGRSDLSEDAAFEAAFDAPPKVPSDAGPAWGHPIRRSADPAASLVRNLVEGQGSLTGNELHRMELYRADRLFAAINALEEEFGGRKNENKRKRLQRLRQHAETLQQGPEEWEEAETREVPSAEALTTAPVPPEPPVDDESEQAAADPEMAEPEPAELRDTDRTITNPVIESEPIWESSEDEGELTRETELPSENDGAPVYLEEETDEEIAYPPLVVSEEEAAWAFETPAEDTSTPAPAPQIEFGGASRTAEESPAEPVAEESAAEPAAEAFAPAEEWVVGEEAAPAEEWVVGEEAAPAEEAAQDEEAGALAGLTTEELAGILASTEDKSIRVAAIDQLVEQPSPEGLQALYQCLEDPDPEIQLHALEAAERLLAKSAAE